MEIYAFDPNGVMTRRGSDPGIAQDVQALCYPSSIRSSTSSVEVLLRILRADRHPNLPARSVCISSHSAAYAMSWTQNERLSTLRTPALALVDDLRAYW
jgi:hypothetical protein